MKYICISLLLFLSLWNYTALNAQESCPCKDCPGDILDETVVHDFHINIFNITNELLSAPGQCVSKVGVKFKHDYVGDLVIKLISPAGQEVTLIGPRTFVRGSDGQTDLTTFDLSFIPTGETAAPDQGFEAKWNNDQVWQLIGGTRTGSYFPYLGNLQDFNTGTVNGTWTLRVIDAVVERNDEGELLDFYVEFCDSEGLVCDPCLDPEDDPCVLMVDPGEATVVPSESFCLPIYSKNVAFLEDFQFSLNWDPSTIQYDRLDSIKVNFFNNNHFDLNQVNNGQLALNYKHLDSLGLVLKDSTAIFQVCFNAIGNIGDSTNITLSNPPLGIQVDGMTMESAAMEGVVKIAVDSTADCNQAIQLCDNSPISVEKTRGPGFSEEEGGNCFPEDKEHQAKWYRFDVLEAGSLEFMIRPKGLASFGYTLYEENCPLILDVGIIEAACQAGDPTPSPTDAPVGVSSNPQSSFGVANGSFENNITLKKDVTYYLLVDNFSANGVGFDLSFAGTAVIGDQSLQVRIEDPATLTCRNPSIRLNALNSSQNPLYTISWSTDTGRIDDISAPYEPIISKGGTFFLEIEDSNTGCAYKDSVFVPTDQVFPKADAGPDGNIDCNAPFFNLSGALSTSGDQIETVWQSSNGNIISDSSLTNITVDAGGLYEIVINNTESGCISRDTAMVTANFIPPQLSAEDVTIDCKTASIEIRASSTTENVMIEWTSKDITIPVVQPTLVVRDTGTFFVKAKATNGCVTADTIFVKEGRVFPTIAIGEDLELNCDHPSLVIPTVGSSEGAEYQYLWTSVNGKFSNNADTSKLLVEVEKGGLYILEITNTENACVSKDTVFIDTSFNAPIIAIQADTVLNCYQPVIKIDASASDSGDFFEFEWFISEGNITEGLNSYQPIADQPGNYIFNLLNKNNGCRSSKLVNLIEDKIAPIANPGIEQTLNCSQRVVILDGTASSTGDPYGYKWTTSNGNFIGKTDEINTNVDSAGVYTLAVFNFDNGCESSDSVHISKDFVPPNLSIPNDSTLTCLHPSLALNAFSATPNTNFTWLSPDSTQTNEAAIMANQVGKYEVIATAANGCTKTDSLFLDAEQDFPKIIIESPETITCNIQSTVLNASASDNGADFQTQWTTIDGNFVDAQEQTSLQATVDQPGTYLLEIINTKTGCISTDSVVVNSDVALPSIEILNEPDTLTCSTTSVSVLAGSDIANPVFQWKSEGVVLSNSAQLEVSAPGIYNILIINPLNNCSSLSTVEVFADTLPPNADAGLPQELNCTTGEVSLDGTNSSQGADFVYLWTTPASENVSNSLTPTVNQPDIYQLTVVNQKNGCRSIDTVRVSRSIENPVADAGKDTNYCLGEEEVAIFLGGANTSIGNNFIYRWEDASGVQISDSTKAVIARAGNFVLQVTNTNNNCVSADTVTVFEKARPEIDLNQTGAINCKENQITYIASSDSENATIKWISEIEIENNILIVSDSILEQEFIAFAEDTITGCKSTSQIIRVTEDRIPPLIDAGKETELNCSDTLRLAGQILSQNIETSIQWSTQDGNLTSPADQLNPIVDAAGTYILNVENTNNFCKSSDTVRIITNQILPTVKFNADQVLTCNNLSLNLSADSLSEGRNFHYEWRNEAGDILGIEKTLAVDIQGVYQLRVIDSTNLCTNFDKVIVLDSLNPPDIEIVPPAPITCTQEQVSLHALVDVENGVFKWSSQDGNIVGDINTQTIIADAKGVYQVEITNLFSGCQSIKSIQVVDLRDDLKIEAGADKAITCYNDSTVLISGTIFNPSENLIYEWRSNAPSFQAIDSTTIFTTNIPGIYILSVKDTLSQCQAMDSLEVVKDIQATEFRLGGDLLIDCQTTQVIIGDVNNLGDPDLDYNWKTSNGNIVSGENEPVALVNTAGVYTLQVFNTNNGCTYQDSQSVFENKVLPTVDVGKAKILSCTEETAILGGLNTSKGAQYVYTWNTNDGQILEGANTSFATVNKAGTYEFSVRDTTNQCIETASINIIEDKDFPVIELAKERPYYCTDNLITIAPVTQETLSVLDIEWFTNDGSIISDKTQLHIDVNEPGNYFIRVGDTRNSCVIIDSILVKDDRIFPFIKNIEDQMLSCTNESISLSAEGSETGDDIRYEWLDTAATPLSNNPNLTVDRAGLYILKLSNTRNSCVSIDTILVSQNVNPPTSANLTVNSPTCNDTEDGVIEIENVIGGTANYEYRLDKVDQRSEPIFTDLKAGDYQLTIIDDLACEWDTMIQLVQPPSIQVSLSISNDKLVTGEDATFTMQTNVPTNNIEQIIWTPTEIFNCFNCDQFTTSLSEDTKVEVTVVDHNGCSGSDSLEVGVGLAPVPNAITPNGDGRNDLFIFPILEKDVHAFPHSELVIFNRWGDVVYQAAPYLNDWDGKNKNGKKLVEGTYYYVLRLDVREGKTQKGDITILR